MKRVFKFLFIKLPLAIILLSVLLVLALKWVPVWVTPIMVSRSIEYRSDPDFYTLKQWRPLEDISPELMKAVITSEDNLFCEHDGFDRKAIKQAMQEKKDGKRVRGASTISQQTAKNVFTLHKRTMWRKAVEMGKGVYGAQAAAQKYFGKDAAALTRREAAILAACLPNPLGRNPANPSKYVSSRASTISRMIPNIKYPNWIERD